MQLSSLGLRTDLAILVRDGAGAHLEDRGDHLVARSPANPDYWFGNTLVLPHLEAGALDAWEQRFAEAFPDAAHRTFLLDLGPTSEAGLAEATARGYEVRHTVVLVTSALSSSPPPEGALIRPLEGDQDWDRYRALVLASDAEDGLAGPAASTHEAFVRTTLAERRASASPERGRWWGAFIGEDLVATLGLLHLDGLGRYQHVVTAAAHRRRGLASALLVHAGRDALARGCHTLVIVAVADSNAYRLYERLGFTVRERLVDLILRPPAFRSP